MKKIFPRYEIKEAPYLGVIMLVAIMRLNEVLGCSNYYFICRIR
jgi:hypothetical protein